MLPETNILPLVVYTNNCPSCKLSKGRTRALGKGGEQRTAQEEPWELPQWQRNNT